MKYLQIWYWYLTGFLKKHRKILTSSVGLGMIFATFSIWVLPYIPRPNPVAKIGVIGLFRPNQIPLSIRSKVSQGLVSISPDGTPLPALAKEWLVSDDGKTYTFFIRQDLYWQDGKNIVASDFHYQLEGVDTKILDDFTLQFTLQDPYTPFPTLLSAPVLKNELYGTTEYSIKKISQKSGYLESVLLESDKKNLLYKFYANGDLIQTAFKLGEINEIVGLSEPFFEADPVWKDTVEVNNKLNTSEYVALFLNNKEPLLMDKSFRQALAYAIEKETKNTRATGPIRVDSWAYTSDVKPYDFNPQKAKDLAKKAMGSEAKLKETTLKIGTIDQFLGLADKIAQQWKDTLGINVEVKLIQGISPDFQILLLAQQTPPDPDQYSLWHSTQTQNFIGFKNVRIDKILEDARIEPDKERRKELYADFQKFFVEESAVIFLYHPEEFTVKRKNKLPFLPDWLGGVSGE